MVTKNSAFNDGRDAYLQDVDKINKGGEKPEIARANALVEGRPVPEMTTAAAVSSPGTVGTAACPKCKKNPCDCKTESFAIQCFREGQRKLTDKLTAEEAKNFKQAAQHLVEYLTKTYKV